ncbi:MAG: Bax inhibitor-1 family protein [Campylobacteraceae bacterium]
MSLYDRDYSKQQSQTQSFEDNSLVEKSNLSAFIRKTYQLFAASLIAGAAGAYLGMDYAYQISSFGFWLIIPFLALYFGLRFAIRKTGLNYILLFAFTFFGGLIIAPSIAMYVNAGAGGIVVNAFILTAVAFGSLSIFAMSTKRDFSAIGKFLFIALIVIVVAMLLNYFVFQSSVGSLIISIIAVLIFSAFILYDTQNIIKGAYEHPIEGAIALYLDVLNLFVHLLNILGLSRD